DRRRDGTPPPCGPRDSGGTAHLPRHHAECEGSRRRPGAPGATFHLSARRRARSGGRGGPVTAEKTSGDAGMPYTLLTGPISNAVGGAYGQGRVYERQGESDGPSASESREAGQT